MYIEGPYKVYEDYTFNCPKCMRVHWDADWRPYWKEDGKPFEMRCFNQKGCRQRLVLIVEKNIVKVTALSYYKQYQDHLSKIKIPMTKIKVQLHAKKYEDVDTADKIALIEELKKMVEADRLKAIQKAKADLAKLESGIFPIQEEVVNKSEPKSEPAPSNEIANEEPVTEPEPAQEEEISGL